MQELVFDTYLIARDCLIGYHVMEKKNRDAVSKRTSKLLIWTVSPFCCALLDSILGGSFESCSIYKHIFFSDGKPGNMVPTSCPTPGT